MLTSLFKHCIRNAAAAMALWAAMGALPAHSQLLQTARPQDPVVVTGAALGSWAVGVNPADVVAFRYAAGAWLQVPVQVDEVVVRDMTAPYGPHGPQSPYPIIPGAITAFYADAGTYVGADTNTTLDADDELVFMARDAGEVPTQMAEPAGVVPGSCLQIEVNDTLNNATGAVFLFLNAGSLNQDADTSYVTYTFSLNAGTYPDDYDLTDGFNLENTEVITPLYRHHFSDRWIDDQLNIFAGNATGVDILDRHQNFFAPGLCVRSENTFCDAEGGFATNRSGPVRAIRSYMGANSGPLTQRTHFFYEGRQDQITDLRVHNIPSVFDVFDYSPAAEGMMTCNNLNPNGLLINGLPDAGVDTVGILEWELVTGAPGSLVMVPSLSGTFQVPADGPQAYYWEDDTLNPVSDCTGDGWPIGTSGVSIVFADDICTDPVGGNCTSASPDFRTLSFRRVIYYAEPNLVPADAQAMAANVHAPLVITITETCPAIIGSTEAAPAQPALRLWPNPSTGHLVLRAAIGASSVSVFDATGRALHNQTLNPGATAAELHLNLSHLPAGVYRVVVATPQGNQTACWVRQ